MSMDYYNSKFNIRDSMLCSASPFALALRRPFGLEALELNRQLLLSRLD